MNVGMMFFQIITLLFLWSLIPALHGHVVGEDWHNSELATKPLQLRIAEQAITMQRRQDPHRHMDVKRVSPECGQERLDSILRSCQAAAAPLPTATPTSGSIPTTDPLVFCGADCNHLVITYANECSDNEFLVNISGACKMSGGNLTVECVYAVVLVKMGITSCIKMVVDVVSTHKIDGVALTQPQFGEYVDEQCCSLETLYESIVTHEVYADRMGRPVIEPPLEPPWLRTISSDYQPVIDVVTTELCLAQLPTELPTTELLSTSQDEPNTNSSSASASSTETANGASGTLCKSRLSLYVWFILFSLSASSL